MCQVHIGAYVSLLAPGKIAYIPPASQERLPRIHVVPITTHTHDKRKSNGKKKKKKYKKINEKKKKARNEKGKEGKENPRKARKTRQEEEARKGKEKNVILADPILCDHSTIVGHFF